MPEQPNNVNSTTETGTPQILSDINSLQKTVAEQEKQLNEQKTLIQRQQVMLTSPEYLNRNTTETPAPAENPNATPAQKFMAHLDGKFDQMQQYVDENVATVAKQVTQLLKQATPESQVWDRTKIAEELVQERPGMDMETAMELAEFRVQKQKASDAARAEEASKIEAQRRADEASMGQPSSTSTNSPPDSRPKTFAEDAAEAWTETGMDEATAEELNSANMWTLPPDAHIGIKA